MSRRVLVAALLVAGALSPVVPGRAAQPQRAQVGFWTGQNTKQCSNTDPTTCPRDLSAYTPAVWKALRDGHGALYFDLVYTVDFGPGATRTDALPILREANALGVTVKAWMTAPLAHGTYTNENNADFLDSTVKAFAAWRTANRLRIDEVVLDLELPLGYQAITDATDPARLMANRGPVDPAHQCAAIRSYRATSGWAHRNHLVLSGSPVPFALDDLSDGNMGLADLLDLGPFVPHGYDHLYLQAYRTYSNTGADYVAGYQRGMTKAFGRAGEISLGDTTMGPPYQTAADLAADVRLAVALGATAIPIFELASSAQKFGADGIKSILDAGRHPMTAAEVTAATAPNSNTTATKTFFGGLNTAASAASPGANPWPPRC